MLKQMMYEAKGAKTAARVEWKARELQTGAPESGGSHLKCCSFKIASFGSVIKPSDSI